MVDEAQSPLIAWWDHQDGRYAALVATMAKEHVPRVAAHPTQPAAPPPQALVREHQELQAARAAAEVERVRGDAHLEVAKLRHEVLLKEQAARADMAYRLAEVAIVTEALCVRVLPTYMLDYEKPKYVFCVQTRMKDLNQQ